MTDNCVFCGTYYTGMLEKAGEAVCHGCWSDIIEMVKKELAEGERS